MAGGGHDVATFGIPVTLEAEVIAKASQGLSSAAIAAWLKEAHGVEVSDRTVRRRVQDRATERADATKGTVREKLGKEVTSDLDEMRAAADRAKSYEAELVKAEDYRGATMAAKAVAEILDKRLHYAGADAEGEERVPESLADLLEAASAENPTAKDEAP
jgi:uncharacterized protein YjbJ (UPF0337 family)